MSKDSLILLSFVLVQIGISAGLYASEKMSLQKIEAAQARPTVVMASPSPTPSASPSASPKLLYKATSSGVLK